MSSRDRDTKSLQDKLKVFFKKGAIASLPARNELIITPDLEKELAPETPLHRRSRAIKDIGDKALHIRIEEGGVQRIWLCTRDLLYESSWEARQVGLQLWRQVAEGQADRLLIMRTVLLRYLRDALSLPAAAGPAPHPGPHPTAAAPPDDELARFRLLHTLTDSGKNITCFEEEVGSFLLEWLPQIQSPALLADFLQLITNVVKFNATYLDEDIVHGIVNSACSVCVECAEGDGVSGGLALLEAVVSYSLLPRGSLRTFVAALCRTVNLDTYCQTSWKLMRYVVGGDSGHAALLEMVDLVCSGGDGDAGLARGAIFYMNMALWGPRRVLTLKVSFLAVLPAFLKGVESAHPAVTYEVAVALQSLVCRVPSELNDAAWDLVLRIVRALLDHDRSMDPPNEPIHSRVHALITSIEQLHDAGQFSGSAEALLDVVDHCGHERPESSAMRLVRLRCEALGAARREGAAQALALADKYARRDPRLKLRLYTLQQIHALLKRHSVVYLEEMVEGVALPVLGAAAQDAEPAVRAAAARAVADLACAAPGDACPDLLDLLEKILNRPFEMYVQDVPLPAESETSDLWLAAGGLRTLFAARICRAPAAHALRCLLVLLDHLDNHYRRPALFAHHPDIRIKIFEMLLRLRANTFNCVGLSEERGRPVCSPFLLAEPPAPRGHPPAPHRDPPSGSGVVPVGRVARLVSAALGRESDWRVLGMLLRALPAALNARALALGRRAQDIDVLAATLCSMISEPKMCAESVRLGGVGKLTVSDLQATALPALAALAPYHTYLEPHTQQRIVQCLLKYGMVQRAPQPFLCALTVFTLEARDAMVTMLPQVLLDLSKVSDTQAIASPMLEFLSTLTRLPRVFASFVEDQYMSVFAILLPYTNPSRYNHYVVSLAHHVIAAWFLKCRLPYRRNFVPFIIQGLHNYIIMPFEEQLQYKGNSAQSALNEDSTNRKRSSSLGSKGVSRVGVAVGVAGAMRAGSSPSSSAAFHVELTETCLDLLARYAFTPCSVKPHRSEAAEFILRGGHAATWLVGHKLITITTSGCLQHSLKQGLCDRCAALCRQHAEGAPPLVAAPVAPTATPAPPAPVQVQVNDENSGEWLEPQPQAQTQNPPEIKRYSKHSLQHSRSTETSSSSLSLSDALLPPCSGHSTRQNSCENPSTTSAADLTHFTQRLDKISVQDDVECSEGGWSRVGALAASGACPCWCAHWAEVHLRSPTGDVSWLMRMQNQMSWDYLLESPLQEVLALLSPTPPAPNVSLATRPAPPSSSSASSGLGDSRQDVRVEGEPRSRSASASSGRAQPRHSDLHSSRASTQPINIPGSPQRQSSSSTTDDDDAPLILPEGKSRHPVRRSNSSPEMSSSWKLPGAVEGRSEEKSPQEDALTDADCGLILLPSCEPTSTSMSLHATKKAMKKSDMRVSCEAIPEEMSGTSPLGPHHHLMTYNSDPGTGVAPAPPPVPATPAASATPALAAPSAPAVSPAPTTPAPAQLQKVASDSVVQSSGSDREELPPLARSKRSNTISVMSPTRRNRDSVAGRASGGGGSSGSGSGGGSVSGSGGGGVTPSFVLLQLYHNMSTYPVTPPVPGECTGGALSPLAERPLRVSGVQHERTLKNLDLVPPIETYKVGVVYVGPGQHDNEDAALRNEYGSVRYTEFLSQLGTLVPLQGGARDPPDLFLNLEKGGKDGRYTYVWHDDIMQVLFHVATAMPSSAADPTCNEKRKYIGNDLVSIVYNDSGHDFNIHTIKGQFNLCIVVVEPLEHGLHRVLIKTKDERVRGTFLPHLEPHVVSDLNVALLARQHALHASLASQISKSLNIGGLPYASNSLERLRHIKRLRRRLEGERLAAAERPRPYADAKDLATRQNIDDFNDYT